MEFVFISAPLSSQESRSFLYATPATTAVGSLCLPQLIATGECKEASPIRETSVRHAPRSMSVPVGSALAAMLIATKVLLESSDW
jgi:hypothetical protein